MIEISFSYNSDRDDLFERLDNICLSVKEKKQAEKKLKNILKTISLTTIFTTITKVSTLAINENFENPELLNQMSNESWWKAFCDNIAAIATVCKMIAKFFINILWIIKNPMQSLYILFNWLSSIGMWALIIFLTFNIFIGLNARTEEVKDKIRHRKSVAIVLYIATLIITLLLKLYLNITN